ncbi:hypothetical protein HZU77_006975 [Neisseriaceae bacterium TC5R-5]|nr:hypothetical protein [Neisseriaceae bacterium TC5R-5]
MPHSNRLSADDWQRIRETWEIDPRLGYTWLIEEMHLSVSPVAIFKRAKKEGRQKQQSTELKKVVEQAHFLADLKAGQLSDYGGTPDTTTAADLRSDVLEQHRTEWQRHRNQYPPLEIGDEKAGFLRARIAKLAAEVIRLRQEGERKAWGLDTVVEETGTSLSTEELDAIYARGMQKVEERRQQAAANQASYRALKDDGNDSD